MSDLPDAPQGAPLAASPALNQNNSSQQNQVADVNNPSQHADTRQAIGQVQQSVDSIPRPTPSGPDEHGAIPSQDKAQPPFHQGGRGDHQVVDRQTSGGMGKEQMEVGPQQPETAPIVGVGAEHEKIPEEVEGWLEKLERGEDVKLPQKVTDDTGQTLVAPIEPETEEEQIVLPMTEAQVEMGLSQAVSTSARWLAEWCMRLVKKFPGHVWYKG